MVTTVVVSTRYCTAAVDKRQLTLYTTAGSAVSYLNTTLGSRRLDRRLLYDARLQPKVVIKTVPVRAECGSSYRTVCRSYVIHQASVVTASSCGRHSRTASTVCRLLQSLTRRSFAVMAVSQSLPQSFSTGGGGGHEAFAGGPGARPALNSRARFSTAINCHDLSLRIWVFRSGDRQN